MLSRDACAANRLQDMSPTLWAYMFLRFGDYDAFARRLCSESLPKYVLSTVDIKLCTRERLGFIVYVNKSHAAARRFYRNCL